MCISRRADEAGAIYHALNRGNGRRTIFHKVQDFAAFERVLGDGLERYEVDVFSYQLMPNHWHMVLRPSRDGEMGRFLRWVSGTHAMRYHAHHQTSGEGHLYQGRFKSFPVQCDDHLLALCRYVERNALRAGCVSRAEDWRWGSLWRFLHDGGTDNQLLSPWPIARPSDWVVRVNRELGEAALTHVRQCVRRGRPFGDRDWTETVASRHGLESTLRSPGRPRVSPAA